MKRLDSPVFAPNKNNENFSFHGRVNFKTTIHSNCSKLPLQEKLKNIFDAAVHHKQQRFQSENQPF